jgi:hypothetical protein
MIMKKLISILITLLISVSMFAGTRENSKDIGDKTRWSFRVGAADTLTVNQGIDFVVKYNGNESISKIVGMFVGDTIAGNDSIYYTVIGYNELSGTGVTLVNKTGVVANKKGYVREFTVLQTTQVDSVATAGTYPLTQTPKDLSFQYYVYRFTNGVTAETKGGFKFSEFVTKMYY